MNTIKKLQKSHHSINNEIYKYYINEIETDWKDILEDDNIRNIKPYNTYNVCKSLSSIRYNKEGLVLKLGTWDNNIIFNDYNIGKELEKINGFIKYICYMECEDNILNLFLEHKLYSDFTNSDSSIIITPYYKYNINNYKWNYDNTYDLRNCIKQIILSYYSAYYNLKIVFNNSNINNILINILKRKKDIVYNILDNDIKIKNCFIEIVINDFENCEKINNINNKYYYNVIYCNLISIIDQFNNSKIINLDNVKNYLSNLLNNLPEPINTIKDLFDTIDNINILNEDYNLL